MAGGFIDVKNRVEGEEREEGEEDGKNIEKVMNYIKRVFKGRWP